MPMVDLPSSILLLVNASPLFLPRLPKVEVCSSVLVWSSRAAGAFNLFRRTYADVYGLPQRASISPRTCALVPSAGQSLRKAWAVAVLLILACMDEPRASLSWSLRSRRYRLSQGSRISSRSGSSRETSTWTDCWSCYHAGRVRYMTWFYYSHPRRCHDHDLLFVEDVKVPKALCDLRTSWTPGV